MASTQSSRLETSGLSYTTITSISSMLLASVWIPTMMTSQQTCISPFIVVTLTYFLDQVWHSFAFTIEWAPWIQAVQAWCSIDIKRDVWQCFVPIFPGKTSSVDVLFMVSLSWAFPKPCADFITLKASYISVCLFHWTTACLFMLILIVLGKMVRPRASVSGDTVTMIGNWM